MREVKFQLYCQMAEGLRKYAVTGIEYLRHGQREISKIYIGDSAIDGRYLKDGLAHLVQYTGLKDKNGKEIYEGDIVKGHWWKRGESHRHVGRVAYVSCAFKVRGVKQYIGWDDELNMTYETIGNIYENPELLEVN